MKLAATDQDESGPNMDNSESSNVDKAKRDHDPAPIPINSALNEMFNLITPKLLNMMESMETLKMWINFHVPKMEDGNNFGVEVQVRLAHFSIRKTE